MQDWSMHELEDIVWEVSTKSNDHIVPCQGGKQLNGSVGLDDACKKLQHEIRNDVGKSTCSEGSAASAHWWKQASFSLDTIPRSSRSVASDKAVPVLCDPVCTSNATALTSWDAGSSDDYVEGCDMGMRSETFFSKNPSFGTNGAEDDDKGCHFSLEDSSTAINYLGLSGSGNKDGENDLMDYDWPDIGNFEDIDTLFRNCDSTFGQGSTGTSDELSWFSSSSHAIYGSEDTFESGLQSSRSELSALNSTSGASLSCRSYADWLDIGADDKGRHANKEEVSEKSLHCAQDGGDGFRPSALPQISKNSINGHDSSNVINTHSKQLESQHSSLKNGKGQASKYKGDSCFHDPGPIEQVADQKLVSPSVSAPRIYASQFLSNQNHGLESPSSSKVTTCSPHTKLEHGLLTDQVPFTDATMTAKFENGTSPTSFEVSDHVINHASYRMKGISDHLFRPPTKEQEGLTEKVHLRQQLDARTTTRRPSQKGGFASMISVGKRHHKFQYEVGGDNEEENQTIEQPAVEADTTVQENSCMTSEYSDDMSVEATSFRQLQDSVYLLDHKTKLCIRDGLYRLARSAEQRHSTASMNNYSRGSGKRRGVECIEASKSCAEFIDAETDTNPIDRSIAHLLFHSPDTATRLADDTTSLESHIINEQIHVPINDKLICQRAPVGSSDMKFRKLEIPGA